jgi:hypothetical protein
MNARYDARRRQDAVHHDPTRLDREIVIAAAKILAAAFDDSKAPALTAIGRSELVEMDDAVRDAMDCAIDAFRGHVIEQYDAGAARNNA